MLWTIMPEETILEGLDKPKTLQRMTYLGKDVIVEKGESGKGTIVQLISTDPRDFLREEFRPGLEIEL